MGWGLYELYDLLDVVTCVAWMTQTFYDLYDDLYMTLDLVWRRPVRVACTAI